MLVTGRIRSSFSSQRYNPSNSFTIEPDGIDEIASMKRAFKSIDLGMSLEHELEYNRTGDESILKEYELLTQADRSLIKIAISEHPSVKPETSIFSYSTQYLQWTSSTSTIYRKLRFEDVSNFKTINELDKEDIKLFMKHHADIYIQ